MDEGKEATEVKARIAFIGTGMRAAAHAYHLKRLKNIECEFVALCDTNAQNAYSFNATYASGRARVYSDHREMLSEQSDLTGVVICTPNDTHEGIAIEAFKSGAHIILEKPLAPSAEASLNIVRAARSYHKTVTLGFVLRYTPFYTKIQELIRRGKCGDIALVVATECVRPEVCRLMLGTWRRKEDQGGCLLEKCCHDIDICNWVMGKLPARVHSFGSRKLFKKKAEAASQCSQCEISPDCPYFFDTREYGRQSRDADEWRHMITWDDVCLYNGDHDICDQQVVTMEYDDGALLSFSLSLACDVPERYICVIGSKGRVEGELSSAEIRVGDTVRRTQEIIRVTEDGSGHHGGDGEIARAFEQSILNPSGRPLATLEDGFHSAMVVFAAERSRVERRPVELSEVYRLLNLEPGRVD